VRYHQRERRKGREGYVAAPSGRKGVLFFVFCFLSDILPLSPMKVIAIVIVIQPDEKETGNKEQGTENKKQEHIKNQKIKMGLP
jgi:hypothetical protein